MNINPSHATPGPSDHQLAAAKQAAAQLKATAVAKASEFGHVAKEEAQHLREAAGAAVEDAHSGLQQLREAAGQTWDTVREQSKQAADQAIHYTQDNPLRVVGFAFGVGLLVGLLSGPSR